MHDGGAFDTLAGQPTDDSELALSLSWSLLDEADYVEESAASHYLRWFDTEPFGVSQAEKRLGPVFDEKIAVAMARRSNFDLVDAVNRSIDRVKEREIADLKKGLGGLATIASAAPFVGLFGTTSSAVVQVVKGREYSAIYTWDDKGTDSTAKLLIDWPSDHDRPVITLK